MFIVDHTRGRFAMQANKDTKARQLFVVCSRTINRLNAMQKAGLTGSVQTRII